MAEEDSNRARTLIRGGMFALTASVLVVVGFALGRWGRPAPEPGTGGQTTEDDATPPAPGVAKAVRTMAYVRGRIEATDRRPSGVTVNKSEAHAGYNLIVSGHHPQALLVDMDGRVVHQWWRPFGDIKTWKGTTGWGEDWPPKEHPGLDCWRRAYLQSDGSLLVIFESIGLVKLNRDSKVVWAYRGGRVHHAADIGPDGRIYALSRVRHRRDLELNSFPTTDYPIIEDHVTVLDPDGEVVDDFSLVDAFVHSEFASALEHTKSPDVLHANGIQLVTSDSGKGGPRAGQLLLSFRHLNMVAALDIESRRIAWVLTGMFEAQHEPSIVPEGNILLFDNYGNDGSSRAVEVDPVSQAVVWAFPGRGEDSVFSPTCGTCQRLANGNTLITESENGRALEVTRAGEVVWEYYSPFRYLETRVALLYDVRRIDRAQIRFPLQSP